MSSGMGRELLGEIRSGAQERLQERIDAEVSRIQIMDITRAAVALLNADVKEETNHRKASVQILEFVAKRGSQVYS